MPFAFNTALISSCVKLIQRASKNFFGFCGGVFHQNSSRIILIYGFRLKHLICSVSYEQRAATDSSRGPGVGLLLRRGDQPNDHETMSEFAVSF